MGTVPFLRPLLGQFLIKWSGWPHLKQSLKVSLHLPPWFFPDIPHIGYVVSIELPVSMPFPLSGPVDIFFISRFSSVADNEVLFHSVLIWIARPLCSTSTIAATFTNSW